MLGSVAHQNPERRFWRAYEPVHAVCYFQPRFASAMVEAGLTGWWNGYFAGRAAPLGWAPSPVVTALFFGFAPTMVARAIPKVWTRIAPESAVQARLTAAEEVLGEHAAAGSEDDLRRITDNLERVIDKIAFDGRALASAWLSVQRPSSLFGRLWLATTVLREHRGDGHVIAATDRGLSGLQASLTHIAAGQVNRDALQKSRGWSDEQWETAERELCERGLLAADGSLTSQGASLRQQVEDATDQLASATVRSLDDVSRIDVSRTDASWTDASWTVETLARFARTLVDRGAVPIPNPIGVPRP